MLLNLCFVQPNKIREFFETIRDFIKTKEISNTEMLLEYFTNYYLNDNDVFNSGFDVIKFWSCYERVLNNIPRTTNGVEAWHRTLNARCQVAHPNLGKFITIIQKEEEVVKYKLTQKINGKIGKIFKSFEKRGKG
jgi:hypothetical protein